MQPGVELLRAKICHFFCGFVLPPLSNLRQLILEIEAMDESLAGAIQELSQLRDPELTNRHFSRRGTTWLVRDN